jgi:hypothetical protein
LDSRGSFSHIIGFVCRCYQLFRSDLSNPGLEERVDRELLRRADLPAYLSTRAYVTLLSNILVLYITQLAHAKCASTESRPRVSMCNALQEMLLKVVILDTELEGWEEPGGNLKDEE